MTTMPKRRSTRAMYRCTDCRIKRAGPVGLQWCPECGGRLKALYASNRASSTGRRTDG